VRKFSAATAWLLILVGLFGFALTAILFLNGSIRGFAEKSVVLKRHLADLPPDPAGDEAEVQAIIQERVINNCIIASVPIVVGAGTLGLLRLRRNVT